FLMVLNGDQAKAAILAQDGVAAGMARGGTVIVSATIKPAEVREIAAALVPRGLSVIDTPVSGGRAGAEAGTLTMMAAAPVAVLEAQMDVLKAVGENIHHVGEDVGMGQTVKGALQAVMGATMASIYEAMVLGAKAGIPAETLVRVFTTSSAGSNLMRGNMTAVAARKFTDTGSGIWTMYKDLGITMAMAREHGVPMFTTAAALELFQAGLASFPNEDNQAVTKVIERAAGLSAE
ncbi:MAG: NAD(P)-dependent oxidoreductase, partial [Inquilinus sp.]|nr:NAD(P)-dependent oxidoreductase [Inquilinus sp.]